MRAIAGTFLMPPNLKLRLTALPWPKVKMPLMWPATQFGLLSLQSADGIGRGRLTAVSDEGYLAAKRSEHDSAGHFT